MNAVTNLFSDPTAMLDNLHAVALEGLSTMPSPDATAAFVARIDIRACELRWKVADIQASLDG